AVAGAFGMPSIVRAQAPVTLNGAVQFNDDHAFNRALIRFEELVKNGKTFIMVTHDVELAKRMPRLVEVFDGVLYENGQRAHP
ncbi:MAG: hypothetical protein AAB658_10900, partial [Chloroflexota bacterium]